jgi:hypothetical protein
MCFAIRSKPQTNADKKDLEAFSRQFSQKISVHPFLSVVNLNFPNALLPKKYL